MGIVGLWKLIGDDRDDKDDSLAPKVVYVDGLYLAIRVATAVSTIPTKADGTTDIPLIIRNIITARRKKILSLASSNTTAFVIVFDGAGVAEKKVPRKAIAATNEIMSLVIGTMHSVFAGAFTIINLPPGVEADYYIIGNAAPSDMIISDDSDMLIVGAPVIRFDGRVYTREGILRDLSERVGRDVTDDVFEKAMRMARNDKIDGIGKGTFLTCLREVVSSSSSSSP